MKVTIIILILIQSVFSKEHELDMLLGFGYASEEKAAVSFGFIPIYEMGIYVNFKVQVFGNFKQKLVHKEKNKKHTGDEYNGVCPNVGQVNIEFPIRVSENIFIAPIVGFINVDYYHQYYDMSVLDNNENKTIRNEDDYYYMNYYTDTYYLIGIGALWRFKSFYLLGEVEHSFGYHENILLGLNIGHYFD
jgi:hypothetical protein